MSLIQEISNDNQFVLNQLLALIDKLSDSDYKSLTPHHGSSIGAHVRHIIEHYQSLFVENTLVNYDKRARDLQLEHSTTFATDTIHKLKSQLASLKSGDELQVICATNVYQDSVPVKSSLARELVFLYSHTTHHMAIIKLLAANLNVSLPCDFGKAASTQAFESNVQSKLA